MTDKWLDKYGKTQLVALYRVAKIRNLAASQCWERPNSCLTCTERYSEPEEPVSCLAVPTGWSPYICQDYYVPVCCPIWGNFTKHPTWSEYNEV